MAQVLHLLLLKLFIFLLIAKLTKGVTTDSGMSCLESISVSDRNPSSTRSSWNVLYWGNGEIMDITLRNQGLKGPFPSGLNFCSSLTGLDLSENSFTGSLPTDICSMVPFLTSLNLSFNYFSGPIPISLSRCQYLHSLDMSNNGFSGSIPPQLILLTRLVEFNVAQNQLTGPIPTFTNPIAADNFANNLDLCGPPLNIECTSTSNTGTPDVVVVVAATLGTVIGFSIGVVLGSFLDCSYLVTRWRIQMINKYGHRAT